MTKDKFKGILDNLIGHNRTLAESLTDEIIFLRGILDKLKKEIKNSGVTDVTLIKSYNLTVQRYGSLVKQLEFMIRQGNGKIQQGENSLQQWLETVNK